MPLKHKVLLAMGVIALIVIAIVGLPGPAKRTAETEPEGDTDMISGLKTSKQLADAVQREGNQVWIDGVPNERVGGGVSGIPRGVALLLKHRGEDVDLDHVLAVSGDAFHLSIAEKWQFMSYMAIPTNPVANILAAYGYDGGYRHTEPMPGGNPEAIRAITDDLLAEYYAKIDAGRPVLVGGVSDEGCGSWSVVAGYDQEALQLYHIGLRESPRWSNIRGINSPLNDETFGSGCWNSQTRGAAMPGMLGNWVDNCGVYLGDKVAEPSARETALKTLALAVKLHNAPTHDGMWQTYFGARAYEHWARELHELDYPADTLKPVPEPFWDVYGAGEMARLPNDIVIARSAAATFCQAAANDLPEAKDHLLAAAKAYREEVAIAKEAFAALLEGSDDQKEAWLSDEASREAGVTAIAQMLEQEQLAVGHVEAALAAVGVAAPGAPTTGGPQRMQAVVPTAAFDIPKLGDMDAEASPAQWGDRGFRVDILEPYGPRKPVEEFGARFRLGWDDAGLWLHATVTDDEFRSAESLEALWGNQADLVLLYVIREAGEYARILIEPGMTADQPEPRILTSAEGNGLGVRVTREKTDTGYILQALVPWDAVNIDPAEANELRAQVAFLDADHDGDDVIVGGAMWYPGVGTADNTNISYGLRLADQPSPPRTAVVWAGEDRITVTATAEQIGKTVTVVESGRTLGEATLTTDESTGYATADIPLPLPALSSPLAQPVVLLDGQAVGALAPIALRGFGMEQDTFSLAIQAAARTFGRDVDYETVACLSSNAFAPMVDVGEDCTSWWMNQAWMADRCIDTIGRRVGLSFRRIELPEAEGNWDDEATMAAYRRKIAPILREVMAGGEIIIATGWRAYQDHGFVPWGWAGIITEARDDGTILGVHPDNGRTDNAIYGPGCLWAVSPAEPTLTAHEADLIVLQHAVDRIRGTGVFARTERAAYGLDGMAAYIEHMRTVPGFCEGCFERAPDRAWTDARDSAWAVSGLAKTAARYLRRRIGTFSVEARPHIEAAARHYDRIVLLLHPALTGEGGRSYQQWINGNLEAQQRHADEVLVPVRAQLAAAGNAMARALAAEGVVIAAAEGPSAATALPDYDKLELEGDHHAKDSFSLTMQAVARLYGIEADYETIYALSTNGFAPDIYPDEPCRSFWRMHGRGQCLDLVAAYLGLDVRPIDPATPETIREALAAGAGVIMDRGWEPDVYCWWGIVMEVDPDDSLPVIRRMRGATQNGPADNPVDHIGRCWAVTRGTPTLTQEQADAIMLRRALSRIRGDSPPFITGKLIFGLAAMDLWIAQMAKADFQEDDPPSSAGNARLCALHTCQGAADTAVYLRERMDSFPGAAQPHLASVAARYERIAGLLEPFSIWEEGRGYQVFMGDVAQQTAHADEVLRPVKAEMAGASEALEQALAAMGVSVPVLPADDPAAVLAEEFTAEELTKLAAWSNLYGNLEIVLREAATNPEFLDLFRQELALGEISPEAATIRGYIGRLEPAEDTYLTHVQTIVSAIAEGEWGDREQPFLMPGREERLAELRDLLADWVNGVSEADALAAQDDDTTVERIYALLGEHTDAKAEAVAGLVGKFSEGGDCDDVFYEWEALPEKTTVAQKMAHHITMLDKPLWHLEYSLSVTLAGIGHGESIGDWRTAGGHLGWRNWINPKDLPRIKTIAAALEAWLGDGDAQGEVAEIVAALGERDAYREKAWLAGCLLHYLRTDGERSDEFVEQLETDWLPLAPEGFTMDDLTDSLVTGDIGWYWPRPTD